MNGKGTGRLENENTSWEHQDYNIIKMDQNTEENPSEIWTDMLSLKHQWKTIS